MPASCWFHKKGTETHKTCISFFSKNSIFSVLIPKNYRGAKKGAYLGFLASSASIFHECGETLTVLCIFTAFLWNAVMNLSTSKCNTWTILPEVIQIIPAIEAKSQGVFLKTQGTEKLPYSLWCTLEDRHLRWDKVDNYYQKTEITF